MPGRIQTRSLAMGLVLAVASCGGGSVQMDARFVAVHHAMTAMGLVQSGQISQGSLPEGAEATLRVAFRPGNCHTIVALGTDGVSDLDVIVRDAGGREVVRDQSQDAQAAVQFCPPAPGDYEVVIRMARGNGGWVATAWSGGPPRGDDLMSGRYGSQLAVRPPRGGPGSCEEAFPLTAGQPVRGDTTTGDAVMTGSCIQEGTAPEHVYAFTLDTRSMVEVVLNSSYDGALYLLGSCGDLSSEIVCNDDAPTTSRSEITATLEPGLYYLVVDGYAGAGGEYEVAMTSRPVQSVAEVCAAATPLVPGQLVTATTRGQPDYFQATCAGQARSGDRVYTLDVAQRSRLRLRMESTYDGAIYMRRDCVDAASQIACNDDWRDTRHSLVTATVDPGRYYVFADGYGHGNHGDYSLIADLAPEGGGGGPGDTCASPSNFVPGADLRVDTFDAADDLGGSCGGQGAPDRVYRLDLQSRTRLRASLVDQDFPLVVYLQSACGGTELFCAGLSSGQSVDHTLAPGTYYLVIDGQAPDAFGSAQLSVQLDDLGALEALCRQAPQIRPGRQITGNTTGSSDRFQATCAGGARSPDLVYRLVLRRTQRVRISSEQSDFDGAIYMRSDCLDGNTEVACNDDAGDNRHSLIEVTLQAGTYFVFVDGYASGNQGRFTLDVDLSNP